MSYPTGSRTVDPGTGALVGSGTYLLGLVLTAFIVVFELHPETGFWRFFGAGGVEPVGVIALHGYLHMPGGGLQPEVALAPYRIGAIGLLVSAGYLSAHRSGPPSGGALAGAAIVLGFFPLTLASTVAVILWLPGASTAQMTGALGIVGILYPAIFGGAGGLLASLT